jgi:DNA phosphorothioation-dependent restriction protein DptG
LREAADSETEADTEVEYERKAKEAKGQAFDVGGFFHYIESHPHLPTVLSWYAQLALNVFLMFAFIYLLYSFWSTIRSDVDKKSQEAVAEVLAEIAVCAKHWKDNQCDRGTVLPALESVCREWENCMNKDHKTIGRAKVSAQTFAEIFNSFIEPISWKAMVCTMSQFLSSRHNMITIATGLYTRHSRLLLRRHERHLRPLPQKPRHSSESISELPTSTTNTAATSELGHGSAVRIYAIQFAICSTASTVGTAHGIGACT